MPKKDQYILDRPSGRTLHARDALAVIFITVALLAVVKGQSIRSGGEKMDPGVQRTLLLAIAQPAAWIADRFAVDDDIDRLTASLSPDDALGGAGGFDDTTSAGERRPASGVVPVTSDAFDPAALGGKPVLLPELKTLLVTGDSMSQPLDVELARRLAPRSVRTVRDPHLGTGISQSAIVDWGSLSTQQVRKDAPEAIVMFLGANEGFPFRSPGRPAVECCGPAWAAQYATRVRRMMETFRRRGAARVYWLSLPLPREVPRQRIVRVVNAAVVAAAQPYRAQVRLLDMTALFTPANRYRASMPVEGRDTIVRKPDGIHLNDAGSRLAADVVMARLKADFASLEQ